jgi:archaellum component FlaC
MTFEESLERLKERHETLTQSVELLYRDIQAQGAATPRNFEIVLDSIKSLERIAASHENRIGDLEDDN